MNQQAIDIIYDEISKQQWESHKVVLRKAKKRISALGDGWIPVTEKYPEDNTQVIVCGQYGIDLASGYTHELGHWIWYNTTGKITHWQPLPLPPITK